jgi:hypothetical protein
MSRFAWEAAGFASLEQLAFRSDGRELAVDAGHLNLLDPSNFAVTRSGTATQAVGKLEYVPGHQDRISALTAGHANEPALRVHDLASGKPIFEKLGACAFATVVVGSMGGESVRPRKLTGVRNRRRNEREALARHPRNDSPRR